jgi:hypothetical protein
MYLVILNNNMVGFSNTNARDMLEHLFLSYGIITEVDLEHNWENMRRACDPQQPVSLIMLEWGFHSVISILLFLVLL